MKKNTLDIFLTAKHPQDESLIGFDKCCLPYTPTHYKYVHIPQGQQMYVSITNDIYGGAGGFVQYDLGDTPPYSWYSTAHPLD